MRIYIYIYIYTYMITYFQRFMSVLNVLPDPGALNSCMHTFPETKLWIDYSLIHNPTY